MDIQIKMTIIEKGTRNKMIYSINTLVLLVKMECILQIYLNFWKYFDRKEMTFDVCKIKMTIGKMIKNLKILSTTSESYETYWILMFGYHFSNYIAVDKLESKISEI